MTIIPDGIEPVRGFRSWSFDGELLRSSYGNALWTPGEPFEAECPSAFWEWVAVQDGGSTLEEIKKTAQFVNPQQVIYSQTATSVTTYNHPIMKPNHGPADIPNVTLPEGWGYESRVRTHECPEETCSCGVYAASSENGVPSGSVWGEVNLWGKVIKGDWAHRARYAYPAKLVTRDPEWAKVLEAYGVPVELKVAEKAQNPFDHFGGQPYTSGTSSTSSTLGHTQFTTMMNQLNAITTAEGDIVKVEWLADEMLPKKKWWKP